MCTTNNLDQINIFLLFSHQIETAYVNFELSPKKGMHYSANPH